MTREHIFYFPRVRVTVEVGLERCLVLLVGVTFAKNEGVEFFLGLGPAYVSVVFRRRFLLVGTVAA